MKNGVRLSSNLSYTLGQPPLGRTVFVYPFQSHTLTDVLNCSGQSLNPKAKQGHLYRCKTLYLEWATSRTLKVNCNMLSSRDLTEGKPSNQTEHGVESSPKTPIHQPKLRSPASSQLTSPGYEDSFSSLSTSNGSSLGSSTIREVLGDEGAKKVLQTCAISWLQSRCVLRGNLVAIPILSELCLFHVKNAEKFVANQIAQDLVNGGSQGLFHESATSFEDLNYAFIVNPETEVHYSLPSNLSCESPRKEAVPTVGREQKDSRISTKAVVPKLGGLSKEYTDLKAIISSSVKNTLSRYVIKDLFPFLQKQAIL